MASGSPDHIATFQLPDSHFRIPLSLGSSCILAGQPEMCEARTSGNSNDAAPRREPHHWVRSRSPLRGDGCGCQGEELASGVGDLDLARLGLLGYRDGCREDPVLVLGGDVLTVQTLP